VIEIRSFTQFCILQARRVSAGDRPTRVGGVPAILADGEQGLLAADNDDEGIARQVLDLLANPIRARALAAAAYDSCRAYAWSEVRDGWLAAYRQAAAPASDAHRVPLEAAR